MKLTFTEAVITELHALDADASHDPAGSHDATLDIVNVLEERPTQFNGTPAFQVAVALLLGYSIGRRAQLQAELYELQQTAGCAK